MQLGTLPLGHRTTPAIHKRLDARARGSKGTGVLKGEPIGSTSSRRLVLPPDTWLQGLRVFPSRVRRLTEIDRISDSGAVLQPGIQTAVLHMRTDSGAASHPSCTQRSHLDHRPILSMDDV